MQAKIEQSLKLEWKLKCWASLCCQAVQEQGMKLAVAVITQQANKSVWKLSAVVYGISPMRLPRTSYFERQPLTGMVKEELLT